MKKLLWMLYQPYKWMIFAPFLILSTLFFGSLTVLMLFIFKPGTTSMVCGVTWARLNAWLTPMFVKVTGRRHIDARQSYVVIANHQSHYDIFVLYGWLGIDFKWVMKQELRQVPALGIACERLGHVFISRSKHASAVESINAAKGKILEGASILFFPEGTRSRDGNLRDFKKGAFRIAIDLGLPLLPITIKGSRNILPPNAMDLMPGCVEMIIHPPISTQGYTRERIQALMDESREAIRSGLT